MKLVKESLNEFDVNALKHYHIYSNEVGELLLNKGVPMDDLTIMFDDDSFQDDLQWHADEGYSAEEYVEMLLNKWSGVPKRPIDEEI